MAGPRRSRRQQRVREAAAPRYTGIAPPELTGVVFDSDVIIEILRGRGAIVRAARALESSGVPTYCTAVAWWTLNRKHYPMDDLRFFEDEA